MTTWEYAWAWEETGSRPVKRGEPGDLSRKLDEMGAEGWEAVTMVQRPTDFTVPTHPDNWPATSLLVLLKRPLR